MQYKCSKIPLKKLILTNGDTVDSLCTSCKSRDCENPIEETYISVFGVNKKVRAWKDYLNVSIVVNCDGYTS